MAVVLIIGASRGIGRGMVQHYAAQGHRVIATARQAEHVSELQALGAQVLRVDVADPASLSGLAWQLDGEKIDLAVYVAGVWEDSCSTTPPTQQTFDRIMHTNVLGAMQAIAQVAPAVQEARGIFAFISSELSLTATADSGRAWLYRASKAALNMVVAAAQHDWPGATLVALDPGWVQTDMGGSHAPLSVAQSVEGMAQTLQQLTAADRGKLLRYDGRRL